MGPSGSGEMFGSGVELPSGVGVGLASGDNGAAVNCRRMLTTDDRRRAAAARLGDIKSIVLLALPFDRTDWRCPLQSP